MRNGSAEGASAASDWYSTTAVSASTTSDQKSPSPKRPLPEYADGVLPLWLAYTQTLPAPTSKCEKWMRNPAAPAERNAMRHSVRPSGRVSDDGCGRESQAL